VFVAVGAAAAIGANPIAAAVAAMASGAIDRIFILVLLYLTGPIRWERDLPHPVGTERY
jgi:hypothetical protein